MRTKPDPARPTDASNNLFDRCHIELWRNYGLAERVRERVTAKPYADIPQASLRPPTRTHTAPHGNP
jgi:hypothetical protein